MKWPREEGSGQKSFVEPSVQCLLKPGLGWGVVDHLVPNAGCHEASGPADPPPHVAEGKSLW